MKEQVDVYKILVHCKLPQMRHGFEASISLMPCDVQVKYTDLSADGIMAHLRKKPDLIVVLLNEADSDFGLPIKIKLFAANVALIVISPAIPERYRHVLKIMGVNRVMELPASSQQICAVIQDMMSKKMYF